ncbi:glycoside hydrolase family 36 protein [Paenibacillus lignilyticus]|uniref:Alpha-galactosidase n=1 Tax=Paenibacillus lignilyticus TaxID=1172615 RepID=A0ABS5C785_9BACL|nr:glycoside hydrolase family 36 protein [Paenibacillus lignilyticus]MBP3961861.1 alpha-galactosidase [Paenibacillus lignilyticus]MBP3963468.1 alpha-galactosidase [Paenibacillus lignilyticus]
MIETVTGISKRKIEHQGMSMEFLENETACAMDVLNTVEERFDRFASIPVVPFQIGIEGFGRLLFPVPPNGSTILPAQMIAKSKEQSEKGFRITYVHEEQAIEVTVDYEFVPGCAVIRQHTSVTNTGSEPRKLTYFSAALLNGLATDGLKDWQAADKLRLHYAHQTWHGEGQWRSQNLEELGLYHHSPHPPSNTIRFSSYGSFSTGKYLPMFVLENKETGKVWYVQLETSTSWNVEIGYRGSWAGPEGCLYLSADAGNERFGNWSRTLAPDETYTSVPVAFGCTLGDFNEAVGELTRYRRQILKPANAWTGEFPVVYNDFMNGIWGQPTRERLEPLIASAAEAGAEVFCIDAGWFMEHTEEPVQVLGDWEPVDERFGEGGLQQMLRDIERAGMTPGIWLEIEMCHERSKLFTKPDTWFLLHNGRRVGGPDRVFLNFAHHEVRAYFHQLFDRLAAMGVGYIKNDYNDYIPHADSADGVSKDGVRENLDAFYSFIDEVRANHPTLILENCGSGAMREDYAALSHFHVQSTSDQEFYERYPSILMGTQAAVLPEQSGIWSYPYPLPFLEQKQPELVHGQVYQESMKDGEQTIFNLVNGMCGNLVLAGHLYAADVFNMALIQQGLEIYKRERAQIRQSVPVYPSGLARLGDTKEWASFGLNNVSENRMLLAVWKLQSTEDVCEIPLERWFGRHARAELIYPASPAETQFAFHPHLAKLSVRISGMNRARLFVISG